MDLKKGFYTALGTPIDADGRIVEAGLRTQIERQVDCEASGLLVLGTMGMQPVITGRECARAAKIAADAVRGRTALFVGVMDNSVSRVMERIEALRGLNISGVVLTPPYYFIESADTLTRFFLRVADEAGFPLYLYDQPYCTKHKLTYETVREAAKHPNIMGIKTNDLTMALELIDRGEVKPEFRPLYSGLDTMDVGCAHGLRLYLDGMFAATPKNARDMERRFLSGDAAGARAHLGNIVGLRDTMARFGIFPSFTACMNMLGMEGRYEPDCQAALTDAAKDALRQKLSEIGEL